MKRFLVPILAALMLYAVACFVRYYTLSPEVQAQTNTFCAANLACTVTGSWALNAVTNLTVSTTQTNTGSTRMTGPLSATHVFVDVTDPTYGAKCDGVTDDTTAIQAAIGAVAQYQDGSGTVNGGVIVLPLSTASGGCLVSGLNLDAAENVTFQAALVNGSQLNPGGPILKFTGTCATNCLSMRSAQGVHFRGIQLLFANLGATGTAIDMSVCSPVAGKCAGNQVNFNGFHAVTITGSSSSNGTLVSIPSGSFIVFDNTTSFNKASVYVLGPTNNAVSNDNILFDSVTFNGAGTADIQNASVSWSVTRSIINTGINGSGPNCTPFLQYTGGYALEGNFTFTGNTFALSAGCTNALTFITLPAVSGSQGSSTFSSNLLLANQTAQNFLNLGNNQSATITGNTISSFATFLTVGTGVSVDVAANTIASGTITTFLSGTPAEGRVIDTTGNLTTYSSGTNGTFFKTAGALNAFQIANNGDTFVNPGRVFSAGFYTNQLTACAHAQFALSAGWGTGAATSAETGFAQSCRITITVGTTPGANPTVTWTLPFTTSSSNTILTCVQTGGTAAFQMFPQSTLSSTAPACQVGATSFTPTAAQTYIVDLRLGP